MIISFGEIMMRFTTPMYTMLEQTNQLSFSFVGTGVNLLSGLYRLGHETAIVTSVPDNQIGRAALAEIRKLGISDKYIEQKGNHIGSYFVELGFGNRPSIVTYQNRLTSSFCTNNMWSYDFSHIVEQAEIVHICGITLSLTKETREASLALAKATKKAGKILCFDFNFRPSLNEDNNIDELKKLYEQMLSYSDIVFGGEKDLTDILGFKIDESLSYIDGLLQISKDFMKTYNIQNFCGTVRQADQEKNQKKIQGFIVEDENIYTSHLTDLTILDRIGGGDAYAAAILHGYIKNWDKEKTLKFAMKNSQISHTLLGDISLFTEKQLDFFLNNPNLDLLR